MGGTKSIHGFPMFVCALCDIEYVFRMAISIDPGGMKLLLGISMFVVHRMILNLLPPSHFLHDANYLNQENIDSLFTSVPLFDTRHDAVTVILFYHAHLYLPS